MDKLTKCGTARLKPALQKMLQKIEKTLNTGEKILYFSHLNERHSLKKWFLQTTVFTASYLVYLKMLTSKTFLTEHLKFEVFIAHAQAHGHAWLSHFYQLSEKVYPLVLGFYGITILLYLISFAYETAIALTNERLIQSVFGVEEIMAKSCRYDEISRIVENRNHLCVYFKKDSSEQESLILISRATEDYLNLRIHLDHEFNRNFNPFA